MRVRRTRFRLSAGLGVSRLGLFGRLISCASFVFYSTLGLGLEFGGCEIATPLFDNPAHLAADPVAFAFRHDLTLRVQRRYLILIAAVIMQMCLGATYSWSVFVAPIRAWWKLPQSLTQLPFTFFYIVFPLMTLAGGQLMTRWPVRWCAVLGGVLFAGGYLLASLGAVHYAFTVLGIGVVAAAGVGFAYLVPLQTCILWFPNHKALVSGIAVAGFGGGAAAVAIVATHLMTGYGYSPFQVLRVVGGAAMILVPLSGWAMVRPSEHLDERADSPVQTTATPLSELIRHEAFWVLYAGMMVGLMAGFAVSIASLWGAENIGRLYGALFTSNAPAALAPLFAGYVYDHTGSFVPALFTLAALLVAGAILIQLRLQRSDRGNG